uniref:Tyrosine-protein phosphatase domain-containing protein n=1 Tax=Ascaris lumbricoides TaxID=6252 RepID=A0A0M3IPJ9_ASCLU
MENNIASQLPCYAASFIFKTSCKTSIIIRAEVDESLTIKVESVFNLATKGSDSYYSTPLIKPEAWDQVAEWLRRWTANPLGFPRVSSNLILIVTAFGAIARRYNLLLICKCTLLWATSMKRFEEIPQQQAWSRRGYSEQQDPLTFHPLVFLRMSSNLVATDYPDDSKKLHFVKGESKGPRKHRFFLH